MNELEDNGVDSRWGKAPFLLDEAGARPAGLPQGGGTSRSAARRRRRRHQVSAQEKNVEKDVDMADEDNEVAQEAKNDEETVELRDAERESTERRFATPKRNPATKRFSISNDFLCNVIDNLGNFSKNLSQYYQNIFF